MKCETYLRIGVLLFLVIFSLSVGRYALTFSQIMDAAMHPFDASMAVTVFYQIRLPRVLLVLFSGGSLALAGYVYQSLFQNPLANGDLLGVSNGASVGAIIAILLFHNPWMTQLFSFIFGIATMVLCVCIAKNVQGNRNFTIILAGIVMSAFASALIMLLKLCADPQQELAGIEFWLMGGFGNASWKDVLFVGIIMLTMSTLLYRLRYQISILSQGEEEALTLGQNVKKVRWMSLCASTLLISSVISVAGIVSWIGFLAPHIASLIYPKQRNKHMMNSFYFGAVLLLFADTIARSFFSFELPISILTSFLGAFMLLYLLKKGKKAL